MRDFRWKIMACHICSYFQHVENWDNDSHNGQANIKKTVEPYFSHMTLDVGTCITLLDQ